MRGLGEDGEIAGGGQKTKERKDGVTTGIKFKCPLGLTALSAHNTQKPNIQEVLICPRERLAIKREPSECSRNITNVLLVSNATEGMP